MIRQTHMVICHQQKSGSIATSLELCLAMEIISKLASIRLIVQFTAKSGDIRQWKIIEDFTIFTPQNPMEFNGMIMLRIFLIRVNSSDIIIEINNNNNSNIITTKINIIYIYIYDMCQSLIYSLAIIIFDLTPVAFDPCDCWVTPSHCVWQMGDTSWPNFFIRPKFHIFSLWFFNFCSFKFLFSWKTSHHSHHSFPREHLPVPVEICQCHT